LDDARVADRARVLSEIRLFRDVEISGVDIKLDGICQVEGFSADLECVMFVPGYG